MVTVGYWVLEESCRQLAAWQERGVTLPLSVNLSAMQLMHPTMVSEMLELIHRYRIKPDTLILEVTESRRIDDPNEAVAILKPLRNAGIRIALDDFGMGYAGLRQLQHMKTLPVDVLKIDKAFVDGCRMTAAWCRRLSRWRAASTCILLPRESKPKRSAPGWQRRAWRVDRAFVCAQCLRMSLKNDTFLVLTITQKCNFVAGLCESAQSF
jgi:hypothetical protein